MTKLAIIALCLMMVSCGSEEKIDDNVAARNYNYFDVVDMIENEKYEEALTRINEVYFDVDYTTEIDGFNKMNLLRLYYEKQKLYDDAAEIVMQYIVDNKLDRSSIDNTALNHISAIESMETLLDKVNDEKYNELINQLGWKE